MGLQLSVLVGCVGALELLACLKHVIVCVLKLTEQPSHCCIKYFHRPCLTDDFVIVEKPGEEAEEKQICSEIEAILRETRSEPDILCIGPPPVVDGYVRIPTPIPFGVDDEAPGLKSSSNASSPVDSGNENPTTNKSVDNLAVNIKRYHGSSSDVSSLDELESSLKTSSKKVFRRSRTPEIRTRSYDDYDNGEDEDIDWQRKHKSSTAALTGRRAARPRSKGTELGRSVENLAVGRRSKRHREPERCKSDIQIHVDRNLLRDEWTNTSSHGSEASIPLSRTSSKKSISVLIQTSFEDQLHYPELRTDQEKLSTCPGCHCKSQVRRVTECEAVDGKPQLIKVSSFEQASEDDYEKLREVIVTKKKDWSERIKSSVDSESYDEYVDAEEEGIALRENPIQYSIPDCGDNQAFWVIRRPA